MLRRDPDDLNLPNSSATAVRAQETRVVHRSCSLCEACCGLDFEVEGDRIVSVRPDHDDPVSKGYVCPKGIALASIHHDPDRLRTPMRRRSDGSFEPISWNAAYDLVTEKLLAIREQHGADAIALYIGNPITHNHGALLMRHGLTKAIGTRNSYSAGSQDTSPRFAASHYLFGSSLVVPVPDIDRTQYFLCIGANPYISQGSAMAGPNVKARVRAIRARGGKVVVVDPRRSETARDADEHLAIRPGGDAAFLLALVKVVVAEKGLHPDAEKIATGWPEVARRLERLSLDDLARSCGIERAVIERIAREFAAAPTGVCYTRIGVCNNRFGTLATYAGELLNIVSGRLGVVGGSMFPTPAFDAAAMAHAGGMDGHARWKSRVRGLPETLGDLPAATMADEIETPGEGQIRALITYAGNPVLSVPNGRRLARAIESLEFMVSVDIYINETTRFADVILPPAGCLSDDHIDLVVPAVAIRNVVRWSPPVVERKDDAPHDWEILHELALRMGGGPFGMPALDRAYRIGRNFGWKWTPTSTAALLLRLGPWGDKFLPWSTGLNLKKLAAAEHGIDLGPLKPGVQHRMYHRDDRVHLAEKPFLDGIDELAADVATPPAADELLLVGRRELRTNNSWMHNVPELVSGKDRCVLYVHPDDAVRAGVGDGDVAILESRVYSGELRVQLTDEMRPGVVSLPHGWGHAAAAPWQRVAGSHPGVSANDWTDDAPVESIVGQSILNGVPVRLRAKEQSAAA
ncbi:MAG TPA: molybdopterin-dependent oxidoreductase [Candidatus Limnocylindrales bacterium]|nr:molybdopterin-dependent oxidoreductase [Candidatus Limnocylindrales bacterium]